MAVGIWIWGSSFLFPQALISVNSGWKGLLVFGLRPLVAALEAAVGVFSFELELELIQTQMAQKPILRAEVGMRVRCANKASAE